MDGKKKLEELVAAVEREESANTIGMMTAGRIRSISDAFKAMEAENERLREALREMDCPRPCNHRPDDFTVGQCFDALECGCVAGSALEARHEG